LAVNSFTEFGSSEEARQVLECLRSQQALKSQGTRAHCGSLQAIDEVGGPILLPCGLVNVLLDPTG
jgi:hypothetical protein